MGKKKVIVFVMVIFLYTLFLLNYAFGTASIADISGSVEGSAYENEYLGIGCQFDGWYFYDKDELKEINSFNVEQWPQDLRGIIQKQENTTLMFAETPNKMLNVNISVSYDPDAEFQAELFGVKKMVSMLHNQVMYSLRKKWGEDVSLTETSASIGSKVYYGFDATYMASGETIYMRQILIAKEDYMFSITATAESMEELVYIYHQFYLLHDINMIMHDSSFLLNLRDINILNEGISQTDDNIDNIIQKEKFESI